MVSWLCSFHLFVSDSEDQKNHKNSKKLRTEASQPQKQLMRKHSNPIHAGPGIPAGCSRHVPKLNL